MAITPAIRKARMEELRKNGVYIPFMTDKELADDFPPQHFRSHVQVAYLYDRPGGQRHEQEHPYALKSVQAAWDKSKKHVDWWAEQKAEREAAERKAEADKLAADKARREKEAADVKNELRERFLTLPGTTETDFEAAFPELLADHRRQLMSQEERRANEGREAIRRNLLANF